MSVTPLVTMSSASEEIVNRTMSNAPSHILSDYIEIAAFGVMFCVGSVTNGLALFSAVSGKSLSNIATRRRRRMQMSQRMRDLAQSKKRRLNPTQTLLRRHLLMSNLFILLVYCPVMVAWLVAYQWPFGEVACKVVQFLFLFSFCYSSNVVACIAADRALFVWKLFALEGGSSVSSSTVVGHWLFTGIRRHLHRLAWPLAALSAAPQFFVFEQISLPLKDGVVFVQCSSIWAPKDGHGTSDRFNGTNGENMSGGARVYEIYHDVVLFCLPLTVIIVSYYSVVSRLLIYSCRPYTTVGRSAVFEPVEQDGSRPRTNTADNGCIELADREKAAQRVTPAAAAAERRTLLLQPEARVPAWRRQMRSRMFRTASTVVVCYWLFWMPYILISVATLLNERWREAFSKQIHWPQCLIALNAVINPLVYRLWK